MLFIDSNNQHVSGVTRPSSGARETVYAAYGTVMLLYVTIGSTVLSMGPWLMSYNIMWLFMVVGYEISFPWLVFSSFFVIVRVYAGGPSAVVFLLGPPAYTHTITKKLENTNQGNEIS